MKQLILKLILPLTILSFAGFTKWWYAVVVDAPDYIMYGFPFIYTCPAFHTSLAYQYFIVELIIDILCYFLFWMAIVWGINRYVFKIIVSKVAAISLWSISGITIIYWILIVTAFETDFYLKRDFEIEVLQTGYAPGWKHIQRPYHEKYNPEGK